jgi:DNA-binding NarL/FixJ family response regulator
MARRDSPSSSSSLSESVDPQTERARNGLSLSPREVQVLEHVARGLTADAMARVLRISAGTVRKHLENAYAKLDCHDRLLAVRRAEDLGVIARTTSAPTNA